VDNWFDDLCKRLVAEGKGDILRGMMEGLAATSLSGPSAVQAATPSFAAPAVQSRSLATSAPAAVPRAVTAPVSGPTANAPGGCGLSNMGRTTTANVSLSKGGITYRVTMEYDSKTHNSISSTIITGAVDIASNLVRIGPTTYTANAMYYAPAVTGVKTVSMTSTDGKTFQGDMDGRAFTTASLDPRSLSAVKFTDGLPPPAITVDASLAALVTGLAQEARTALASCGNSTPGSTQAAHPSLDPFREVGPDPGSGWYEPGETYSSPDCTNCWNNSVATAKDKSGLCSWEVQFCPPCWPAAFALFNAIAMGLWATCQLPGGGCCPVPCGGAFTCCGRGDHCFRGDLCCPYLVCNNVCCGPFVTTCASDGFCGCPSGQIPCGTNCCAPGTLCCGGTCCPSGSAKCCGNQCCPAGSDQCCGDQCCPNGAPCINNSICCPSPSHVCGTTCCAPFNICCGSTCCGTNEVCLSDVRTGATYGCCPASQACGVGGASPICCPAGQICVDQHESTCGACPSGQVSCLSSNENGSTSTVCCAPGVECCNGICCKPAEICCKNIYGSPQVFGCHLESQCIG
jgi:hypothetical protein